MPASRTTLSALAAAVVVVAAVVGVALSRGDSTDLHREHTSACTARLAESRRMARDSFDFGSTRVDVLGDSYSVGAGLADPHTQTWDVLLAKAKGWHLVVRGISGTGFVNGGACGDRDYRARVAQVLADKPSIVIVEGGLNDIDRSGAGLAARRLLDSLPSTMKVIVIGPPDIPAGAGEQAVDRELRAAVGDTPNRQYVSTVGWQLSYLPSGVHLTVAGHRTFAKRLAEAIS